MGQAELSDLLRDHHLGVLATIKSDGRPQLSNVVYAFDPAEQLIRVSVTEDRAKTNNLRRDPRGSLHVTTRDGSAYVVAEGTAELTPVTREPGDATSEDLVGLYRAVRGEHPDWDEYRRAMIEQRRLALRLHVERLYGNASG